MKQFFTWLRKEAKIASIREMTMKKASLHPLRIARYQRNLTIPELAEGARVGTSTIWRAEHNYQINAESRRRLCAYFGMTSQALGLLSCIEAQSASDYPDEQSPGQMRLETRASETVSAHLTPREFVSST